MTTILSQECRFVDGNPLAWVDRGFGDIGGVGYFSPGNDLVLGQLLD